MPSKANEFAQSFTLDLGMDNTAHPSAVQPFGPAGALVSSTNTRLSKTRGVPRKSPQAAVMTDPVAHTGSTAAGGVIPCGHMASSLVVRNRRYGGQRIAGTELMALATPFPLQGPVAATGPRNYWPADVTRAGVVPNPGQYTAPATCAHNGFLWFASIRQNPNNGQLGVYVTVLGQNGECAALPREVVNLTSGAIATPPWVGLTAHGANGVRLWYRSGTSTSTRLATLTIVNGVVTAPSNVQVYLPTAAGTGTYDVAAHDDTTAYLVTLGAALATDVALHKVNVATNTVTNTTLIAAGAAITSKLAVKSAVMSGGARVAVCIALAAGSCSEYLYQDAGTPALLHSFTGVLTGGEPLVGFYRLGTVEFVVYGVADSVCTVTTSAFTGTAGTIFQFRTADTFGTPSVDITLPWTRAISRLMTYSPASGELYPMFCVQTCWDGDNGDRPTNHGWLSDPDVRVLRIDSSQAVSCVGRFGVDTTAVYPPDPAGGVLNVLYNSQAACIAGDKFAFVYLERQVDFDLPTTTSTVRYVEMDFAPRQPRFAVGADGVAIIAGAMPMEWDGVVASEICPPVRPKVAVATTGGTGAVVPAGTYLVSAVQQWIDAAGILHRSMPAETISVTATGAAWIVYVSVPPALVRDGGGYDRAETVIYVSQVGGTVLYRQYPASIGVGLYLQTFDNITLSLGDAVHPPIYSTGDPAEELMSQHPPAFADVEVVSDRAWGIEAERPGRLWHSKSKTKGIAYEWSSDLIVDLPPRAGSALSVVDLSGSVAALCTGGVWAVTGSGPDNALLSGGFNPPEQVSDTACTDRGSVIRTPAGVLFISNGRFAMIGPGGARVFEQVDASALGAVCPVLLRETHEAVWLSASGVHMVYNYQLDRWTSWGTGTVPALVCAARDPVSGYVNLVRASDGAVWQLDPRLASLTAQLSFETGDMVFGGPEDDNVVNEVVLRAQAYGSHGVAMTLTTDYGQGEGTPFTRVYSPAEVAACTVAGQYTLSVSPGSMCLRALKVAIAETGATGDGMGPLSLTVQGARNGGTLRSAVRAAGRK
jgi:hypothetical protein